MSAVNATKRPTKKPAAIDFAEARRLAGKAPIASVLRKAALAGRSSHMHSAILDRCFAATVIANYVIAQMNNEYDAEVGVERYEQTLRVAREVVTETWRILTEENVRAAAKGDLMTQAWIAKRLDHQLDTMRCVGAAEHHWPAQKKQLARKKRGAA